MRLSPQAHSCLFILWTPAVYDHNRHTGVFFWKRSVAPSALIKQVEASPRFRVGVGRHAAYCFRTHVRCAAERRRHWRRAGVCASPMAESMSALTKHVISLNRERERARVEGHSSQKWWRQRGGMSKLAHDVREWEEGGWFSEEMRCGGKKRSLMNEGAGTDLEEDGVIWKEGQVAGDLLVTRQEWMVDASVLFFFSSRPVNSH